MELYCQIWDILGGFTLESETPKAAKDLNSKIRSRERFFDSNRKYDLAQHKFQKSQILKAQQLYQSLPINLVAVPEDRTERVLCSRTN